MDRRLLVLALFSALFLTACGSGDRVDFDAQYSDSGLIPEDYLPADVSMVVSYSLQDDKQFESVQSLEKQLEDHGRFSRTVSSSLDTQFTGAGLDYERDLQAAFGDQFRLLYAVRSDGDKVDAFTVVTLNDPDQLLQSFDALVETKKLEKKELSDRTVYLNSESAFYATLFDDLLLVASDPDLLMTMTDASNEDTLWSSSVYQDALNDVGSEFVLYGAVFPQNYPQSNGSTLALSSMASIADHQVFVMRADEEGLAFDLSTQINKEQAKKAGLALDTVPHEKAYLYDEVPAKGLVAYFESYGLQESFEQTNGLGAESSPFQALATWEQNYFGMDFGDEFLGFWDRGYSLALHDTGGVVPGISVYVDVSSDLEHAKEFLNKLDGQMTGLYQVYKAALPDAVTKDTVMVDGNELTRIQLDLSSVPRKEDSPLPAVVMAAPIQIIYGLMRDDRLLVSTASVWGDSEESVASSELYSSLSEKLTGVDEGLIVVDAEALADFFGMFRSLREQLNLQVSDQVTGLEDFLQGFSGAIAESHTNTYESRFSGYLMLAQ